MLGVMLYLRKFYIVDIWKIVVSSLLLTISGLLGAKLMFWIESGKVGGVSFFGAIFLPPLSMSLVAMLLSIPVGTLLDMCAPAECIMLALLKIKCFFDGCCKGKVIYVVDTLEIRFPSQMIEMLTVLGVFVFLLVLIRKGKYAYQIYAWYMVGYGITRFGLNLLRETEPFVWILPAGNFWALISSVIGVIWIVICKRKKLR